MKKICALVVLFLPIIGHAKAWPWPISQHCQNAYLYKNVLISLAVSPSKTAMDNALITGDLLDLTGKQVLSDIEKQKSDPNSVEIYKMFGTPMASKYMREEIEKCKAKPEGYIPNFHHLKESGLITND